MTERDLMEYAVAQMIADPDNGVTGAYIDGDVIVCQVGKKRSSHELSVQSIKPVPRTLQIQGHTHAPFKTRVEVAQAIYRPLILPVGAIPVETHHRTALYPFAGENELRRCQTPTIPGGPQIAPQAAKWVGTNGGAVALTDAESYGFLTNWHVANGGEFGQDSPQCQPDGSGPVFGHLRRWGVIKTQGEDNLIDAAYIEDKRWKDTGGREVFGDPSQYGFGKIDPRPYKYSEIASGLRVQKSGRTTGHTTGKVVGVGGTFFVGYPHGNGKFVRQILIRGDSGLFSNAGDSGSLICDMDNRPVCLLFAGGGEDTIACAIEFVIDGLKIQFWQR